MSKIATCIKVVDALNEQMRTKSIAAVKVTDLCRAVGISRATFYDYFNDVYAVATWFWDYLMENTLYQAGISLSCREAHLRKFQALRTHAEFFGNVFKVTGYESVTQHGGRVMEEHYLDVFRQKTGREPSEYEALMIEYFTTGAKHMTRHYAESGMVADPEVMAQVFTDSMPDFMVSLLEPAEDAVQAE